MKNPDITVPNQFLNFFSSRVPDVWKTVDYYYRYTRGAPGRDWDNRVFMPLSGWNCHNRKNPARKFCWRAGLCGEKPAEVMGAWRPTQGLHSAF